MEFPSSSPHLYDKDFPYIRQPNIIGEFSMDGKREFQADRSQLQLLNRPQDSVSFDLNKGLNTRISKSWESEGLDTMLRWILNNRSKFGERSLNTDFVSFRGLLRLLLNTPYEQRDPWIIRVTRWRGTVYLLQEKTIAEKEREKNMTERDKKFTYWGYKFEHYMNLHDKDPGPVNENEEFCCIFRTRLAGLSLMYGAEMDGYISSQLPDGQLNPSKFVEYKTSRIVETDRQDRSFRKFKLIKWWAQSFLVGIEEVLCGWRDDHGIVHDVESFKVSKLAGLGIEWKANVCANFLLSFLSFLSTNITSDSPTQVYRVTWDPRQGFSSHEESSSTPFLPSWYTDNIFKS